jgi:radical SAM protein with 4Fe4S-binding SPASM domain
MTNRRMLENAMRLLTGRDFRFSFDQVPLCSPRLDAGRRFNLLLAGLDQVFGRTRMLASPPVLQIEPTNTCNLACPLCPSGSMTRARGMMSAETFETILRDVGDTLMLAILYGWGEPFLNPALPEMMARCRDRGVLTLTSTNGHFLQTPEKALKVVDAELTALIIAIDGATQESYATYRRNGTLDHALRCVTNVQEARARRNSATPFTNLRLVANRHNEEEIGRMEEMARELGVNMFSVKSLGCLPDKSEFTDFVPGSEEMRRFGDSRKESSSTFRCRFPFRQPTVFWDGTVVGCEFDYEGGTAWGNVNGKRFGEIWNSPAAMEMRRSIRKWTRRPEFCRKCPYVGRGRNSSIVRSVVFE